MSAIREIVAACQQAPSGDNCQPWRFTWDGATLAIHHDDDRAAHPLNRGHLGSLLTLGCVIESAVIAASALGIRVGIDLEPVGERIPRHGAWARLQLSIDAGVVRQDRAGALAQRCTDRRLYQGGAMDDALAVKLLSHTEASGRVNVLAHPDAETRAYITRAECGMLDHPAVMRALLAWVRFTRRAAEQHRDGLPVANLGVRATDVPMLWLLRACPWLVRPLAACGGCWLQRRQVDRQLRSSSALVLVSVQDSRPASVIAAGRLALRTWLELTQAGYGVQPLTQSALHAYRAATGERLPPVQMPMHADGATLLARAFHLNAGELPVWLFRCGPATPLPPAMRTLRQLFDAVLTVVPGETTNQEMERG
jgi:hypothetical protein